MAEENERANDYLICRSTEVNDYSVWRIDLDSDQLLHRMPGCAGAKFDRTHQLLSIGNYILEWGPITLQDYSPCFSYRLFTFDANIKEPLGVNAKSIVDGREMPTRVTNGVWPKNKFWRGRPDFGNPEGAAKAFGKGDKLMLVPLGTFVLNIIPTTGRGTFKLFNFDPRSGDPLIPFPTMIAGSFETIQFGHELIPLGNYVLDRLPETREYWLWSFDPMDEIPLARPVIQKGCWDDIDENNQLIPIGDHVFDWDMKARSYRLWRLDPKTRNADSLNPLAGPVKHGPMPKEFDAEKTSTGIKGNILTGIQGLIPIHQARKNEPGTIDFMRTKIKHVVYYIIENCSFDHVCGWLYEKGEEDINFVPPDRNQPFKGAKHAQELGQDYNVDPDDLDAEGAPKKVYLEKFNYTGGKLDFLPCDPYHDTTDTMRQFFFRDRDGYVERRTPTMDGFVWNNGVPRVMWTFTPEQLPVLNGLARAFAVSDEWFSPMPGATDSQRAFALTGSSLRQLDNFMTGPQYANWPDDPHRASIWKVLWANGFTDWKIYNSVMWPKPPATPFVLTYHLFLEGQIASVDAKPKDHIAGVDEFKEDARKGNLPTFSFLEPVWIASDKPATSYHPAAEDGKTPGEKALNEIYEVLKAGPKWNETLLIITFDEHGGVFDHVPPPYAHNPWPNDVKYGFRYDLMGVRVPTILVSPWIKQQTVFRSSTPIAYDSTSVLATLLSWYGIPKARWGLGERTHHAPTFEGVFQCQSPRSDAPSLPSPPSDEALLRPHRTERVRTLHQHVAWRMINYIASRKLSARKSSKISDDILASATDVNDLRRLMDDLVKRMG